MGSESSKSDSESSNSADDKKELETLDEKIKDQNAIIQRVWIAKKSISVTDEHINLNKPWGRVFAKEEKKLSKLHKNLFKMESKANINVKHWAMILELSNNYFVNIQFGKNGISLKEFEETDVEGENIFYSIIETWGEKDAPISFCYLGKANIEYQKLKIHLKKLKEKESKRYKEEKRTFYNLIYKNCQEFCCCLEEYIFREKKFWHSFDYYINEFYNTFFPKMDITEWKLKYEEELKNKNEEIFQNNLDIAYNDIKNKNYVVAKGALVYYLCEKTMNLDSVYVPFIDVINDIFLKSEILFIDNHKNKIKQLYSLNIDDYLK